MKSLTRIISVGFWAFLLSTIVYFFLVAMFSMGCKTCPPCVPEIQTIEVAIPVPQPFPEPPVLTDLDLMTPKLTLEAVEADGSVLVQALTHDILLYADMEVEVEQFMEALTAAREYLIQERDAALRRIEEANSD